MTESEVLFTISNIVNGQVSFSQAVDQIALVLEREAGCKGLVIEESPGDLPESFDQPDRSVYRVDLRDGGETLGKAIVCFAAGHFEGALLRRLADFVGEQLGMFVARTRLAERRAQLKAEIEKIEDDLTTRKVMQRAEGILIAKRGMALGVARRWIAQQSRRTGLSKKDVGDRIIAYHQATGLLEQRIA